MFHIIRNNFICIFAIMTLFAQTAPVAAKIISGTVTDKCASPLFDADVVALPKKEKEALKTQTNENGHFTLDVPAETKEIRISYLGFKPITYPVDKVPESIKLDRDPDLNDVDKVSECRKLGSDTTLGVAVVVAEWCTQAKKDAINATDAYLNSVTEQCIPTVCKDSYRLEGKIPLRENGEQVTDEKGNKVFSDAQCVKITGRECNGPRYKLVDNNCVDQVGTDCKSRVAHAVAATYQMNEGKLVCIVEKCDEPGWGRNDAHTKCEESNGPCPAADIAKVPNATAGELKKGSCYITECGNGYHPSDDGKSCEQAELSEEDSKNKISELKDNAQKMKDKEQSTANKALGAAAIGATGIGGMNLMSGMAEQKADDAAEEDMKAYLATFVCDYGQGRNIKGGERDIDLPGGNELLTQVNEYKALAADLKIRKEALGKTPGIEAEVIYDIAETGLYDNVGMGRQSGAYASVSKALMDENSDDAKAWAEQKADTASKIKTGAITAGIGAIGGLVGNLAINSGDKNKNQVDKIISDYDKKKQAVRTIQEKVDREPETTTSCSDYTYNNAALTGNYPDCNCGDKAYFKPDHSENDKLVGCIPCIGDTVPNTEKTQCICTNGRTPDANGICPSDSNPCTLSGDFVNNADGKCECIAPATPNNTETGCICDNTKNNYKDANGNCAYCNPATHTLNGNECTEKPEETQLPPIIIKSDKFFNLSKATFKSNTDAFWTEFVNEIQQIAQTDYANYNVCITGQTDPSTFGRNSRKNNEDLSAARAYTVFNEIKDKGFKSIKYKGAGAVQVADTVESIGDSSKICNPARTAKSTWGNCRRVLITISAYECPSDFIDSAEEPSFYNLYK